MTAWEQRKFSDLTDRVSIQSNDPNLPQVEYEDIISGEGALNKDLNDKEGGKTGIKFYVGDVLYGKLRPYLMNWLYPQFNGVAVGDFWVLRATECDSSFLYRLVQTDGFQRLANVSSGSKMPRADWNLISQSFFAVPSNHAEQKAIAKSLAELDSLITLHQRKYDKLCTVKKSMLDKMFPKPGETEPEIRFEGFTDPWEQRKLGELYSLVSEKNDLTFGRESIISVSNMYFNANVNVTDEQYLRTYNVMRLGDIAFEGHSNKEFSHGRFVENYIGDGIVSHIFTVLRPRVPFDVNYWRYAINNEKLMRLSLIRSTKASTMMHDLVPSDFLREAIPTPTLAEQKEIGAFLVGLDHLITLHQRMGPIFCFCAHGSRTNFASALQG